MFRILGPLEAENESGPIALRGQKQRSLLALLLIHAGETLSGDRLVDELWGEQPPRTATTSLHNLVVQLRKLLGPDLLLTKPPGYVLRIPPDALDLKVFERLVGEARRSTPEESVRLLRDALALWRGPPLADVTYERFAEGEIQRLEELRLEAVQQLFEAQLASGAGAELVAELESLVAAHPLRERLRGQLMLALYRAGRQAQAMDVYHDGRRRLVDELGIEPSRELQMLYASILRQEATLDTATPEPQLEDHYGEIVKAAVAGRLVIVLGAGARTVVPPHAEHAPLPGPAEVAAYLAECFDYPTDADRDLARVSQYVALMKGVGPLYDELHDLFDHDYEPTPLERELATLATALRERGSRPPVIVTAAFDHALERAFTDSGEEFDTVCYIGSGRNAGKFLHVSDDGAVAVIDVPNTYVDLVPDRRTVILKIHGQVDRSPEREWESFVVSEDDYIDFLAAPELAGVVPVGLVAKLRRSHFLFLGYPLQTWHVRVLLHRLWGRARVNYRSWAIQGAPDPVEREAWRERGIDVFDVDPQDFVQRLAARLLREAAA
ncbi:MAG: BTAD domain-containing putative transcriptional regulator [Gaiellaceae bacterium]